MKQTDFEKSLTHDRLTDQFDALMNEYDISRRLEVLVGDFLGDTDLHGKLVLDAGCGTGRGTARLQQRGAQVVSLDLGMRLLQYTREHYGSITTQASVLQFPFADNTFDVVFSTEVIEHTPDPLLAVTDMVRVLKPGGKLVLSTPNWLWQLPVRAASALRLRPYDGIENFPKPADLQSTLRHLNGRLIEHRGLHLIPFQIKALQPVSRYFDRFGRALLPVMINQCLLFEKGS